MTGASAEGPSLDPIERLFELAPDMLGAANGDGHLTYLNPAWETCLGWAKGEMIGRPLTSLVHPEDLAETTRQLDSVTGADAAAVAAFENRYRTREGDYRRLRWHVIAQADLLLLVAEDVTRAREDDDERGRADVIARQAGALHRTLTANLPDTSVFLIDHDLRVMIAEGEAIRRLSWSGQDQFRGRLLTELFSEVPDEVLQLSLTNYSAVLKGERRSFDFISGGLTMAVQAVPVRDDHGTVESALVVVRDVTQHALAQQQIARRACQQDALARLGWLALRSHDLTALMADVADATVSALGVAGAVMMGYDDQTETLTAVAGSGMAVAGVRGAALPLARAGAAGLAVGCGDPVMVPDLAAETRFEPSPEMLRLGVHSGIAVPIEGSERIIGALDVHALEPRGFAEDEVAFLCAVATLIAVAVERDRDERATRHAALHDPLTDLPNRTLALDRLGHALARRRRERVDVGVFVLDVDRFKIINDSLGHAAGDEVLLALGARLTAALRPTDTVARLGGDEFVVICPELYPLRGATEIAERLAAAVSRAVVLGSGEHFFTVSIGIAIAGSREDTPESLLGDADAAMYRAKVRGRGRYEMFDEAMRTSVMGRLRLEAELRRALDRDELRVYFQPMVDLGSGRVAGTEALVRWQHPERGLIGPQEFIPIAEESGLIVPLGLYVLDAACRQTAAWRKDLDPDLKTSVNVSGRQATNPLFPAQAAAIAERHGLERGTLALEITETVLMEEAESPAAFLRTFQEHGLSLMLDDFGTGFSSLSRLKRLPLDVLKVDRSFVSGMDCNAEDRAIVKATIDMAHAMGLTVVAEGVENREQQDRLRANGCDLVQGYLYSRPQPAEAIGELLAAVAQVPFAR